MMGRLHLLAILCALSGSLVICFPTEKIIIISDSLEECFSRDGDVTCNFNNSETNDVYLVKQEPTTVRNFFIHDVQKLHVDESICSNVDLSNIEQILTEGEPDEQCKDGFQFAAKDSNINKTPQNVKKMYLENSSVNTVATNRSLEELTVINSEVGVLKISGPFLNNTSVLFQKALIGQVDKLIVDNGATLTVDNSEIVAVAEDSILIHPNVVMDINSDDFNYTDLERYRQSQKSLIRDEYSSVPPSRHSSLPPSRHSSVAPSRHSSVPPSRHSSVPPSRHSSVAPSRHSSVPPFRHSSVPPSRHSSVPPSRHWSVPPSRYLSAPPNRHASVPLNMPEEDNNNTTTIIISVSVILGLLLITVVIVIAIHCYSRKKNKEEFTDSLPKENDSMCSEDADKRSRNDGADGVSEPLIQRVNDNHSEGNEHNESQVEMVAKNAVIFHKNEEVVSDAERGIVDENGDEAQSNMYNENDVTVFNENASKTKEHKGNLKKE